MIALGGIHKLHLQDLAFFDHLLPSIYIFYGIKVYKKLIFWPPLVNVLVWERPLIIFVLLSDIPEYWIKSCHTRKLQVYTFFCVTTWYLTADMDHLLRTQIASQNYLSHNLKLDSW